ncbi:PhzF family phenazine biosynthesis protein, partial [Maribellus luteus]
GNPAAVVPLEHWLPEQQLQDIAAENNLSETAYFVPLPDDRFHLRWFTPVHEVEFCGHATLATAHVLAAHHEVIGEMAFSTRVGELRVARADGGYRMDLPSFPPEPLPDLPAPIAELFADIDHRAFRNFENIFVELPDEAAVRAFIPDLTRIATLKLQGLVITGKGDGYD